MHVEIGLRTQHERHKTIEGSILAEWQSIMLGMQKAPDTIPSISCLRFSGERWCEKLLLVEWVQRKRVQLLPRKGPGSMKDGHLQEHHW